MILKGIVDSERYYLIIQEPVVNGEYYAFFCRSNGTDYDYVQPSLKAAKECMVEIEGEPLNGWERISIDDVPSALRYVYDDIL